MEEIDNVDHSYSELATPSPSTETAEAKFKYFLNDIDDGIN